MAGVVVTAWDWRVFSRALGAATLTFALAWLITAATDEGGVTWAARAGRTLPLVPVCAAIGAWIGLAAARARGELRALEALGLTPSRSGAAAVTGAAALAIVASAALGSPAIGVEGFYPAVPHEQGFHLEDGALVDDSGELRVGSDGVPERISPPRPATSKATLTVPVHGRSVAVLVTLLAGLALPLLVARPPAKSAWRIFALAGGAIVATLIVLQAAAAQRIGVWWATAPPLLLFAGAVWRYRSEA